MGAKSGKEGFIVAFPNALARDPSKRSRFKGNPQLWNDGSKRFYGGQNPVDDIAFINAALDDLEKRYNIDKTRIFVTGFSNGASMTFRVGVELASRIAAIAPVAGSCWLESCVLTRPVSMCYATGTADPLNPIEGGAVRFATGNTDGLPGKPKPSVRESISRWVKACGLSSEPTKTSDLNGVRKETFGPGRDGVEVDCISVADMGHTWAGGRSLLSELLVGKQSDKLNMTDQIWEFFHRHPMKTGSTRAD